MVVAFDSSDMMKNWPVKMLWKAEQTHDRERHRQQLLVSLKTERQSKLHGNELQSVVSHGGGGGGGGVHHDMVHIGLCGLCKFGLKKGVDFDHIGLE